MRRPRWILSFATWNLVALLVAVQSTSSLTGTAGRW
jgi:hypothetical protein